MRPRACLIALLLASTTACTSDESERRGQDDPDASPSDGESREGQVFLVQNRGLADTVVSHANASFEVGARCDTQAFGDCKVCEVDLTQPGPDEPPLDAGTVTLTGPGLPGGEIALAFDPELGVYDPFLGTEQVFTSGQTIRARSSGAQVPAFEDVSVTAPDDIALIAPGCADGTCGGIVRSAALDVEWTGGAAGQVEVAVTTTDNETQAVVVSCVFDPGAGQGTVPAAALSHLMVADGETVFGFFEAVPVSDISVPAGEWQVRFSVSATKLFGTVTTE